MLSVFAISCAGCPPAVCRRGSPRMDSLSVIIHTNDQEGPIDFADDQVRSVSAANDWERASGSVPGCGNQPQGLTSFHGTIRHNGFSLPTSNLPVTEVIDIFRQGACVILRVSMDARQGNGGPCGKNAYPNRDFVTWRRLLPACGEFCGVLSRISHALLPVARCFRAQVLTERLLTPEVSATDYQRLDTCKIVTELSESVTHPTLIDPISDTAISIVFSMPYGVKRILFPHGERRASGYFLPARLKRTSTRLWLYGRIDCSKFRGRNLKP
jgi:hypothetical protein